MNAIDALKEWAIAEEEYRYLMGKMSEYKDYIGYLRGLSGFQGDGTPKASTPSDPTPKKAERVLSAKEEYDSIIKEIEKRTTTVAKAQMLVESVLIHLDPIYRTIAEMRYKKRCKWQGIAMSIGYEVRSVMRRHDDLLKEIEKRL